MVNLVTNPQVGESKLSKPPKRLYILDDEEIEALYARPLFTEDDRTHAFMLTQSERDLLASFTQIHVQLYFILQLGYFKAKQLFFTFTFQDVADDVAHLLQRYFPDVERRPRGAYGPRPTLRPLNKRTILKQRQRILELFQYRLCMPADRQLLFIRAQQAARISSKPVYVFREILHYLAEQRIVSPGYTVLQEEIVGKALTAETMRLTIRLQTQLSPTTCVALNQLVAETGGLYPITLLKRQPRDFSLGEMRREITCGEQLAPLYHLAMQVVPELGISNEGITYYASLVSYYSVFRLKQLDTWTVYLYLLCFIVHRYQRFNDNLLTCFIYLVKQYSDEAKTTAKEEVYQQRVTSNRDVPKAGQVLKLFTTDLSELGTAFGTEAVRRLFSLGPDYLLSRTLSRKTDELSLLPLACNHPIS